MSCIYLFTLLLFIYFILYTFDLIRPIEGHGIGPHLYADNMQIPINTVASVHDLGIIFIDANLSMRTHVQQTVSRCFAVLRQLWQICKLAQSATFQALVVALAPFWLDYGIGLMVGPPANLAHRLQSALNAPGLIIFQLRCLDHITNVLVSLRWLCIAGSIHYKIAVLMYKVLHGTALRKLLGSTRSCARSNGST